MAIVRSKTVAVTEEVYTELGLLAQKYGSSVSNVIRCLVDGVKSGSLVIDVECLARLDPKQERWKRFNQRAIASVEAVLDDLERGRERYSVGELIRRTMDREPGVTAGGIRRVLGLVKRIKVSSRSDTFELVEAGESVHGS